MYNQNEKSGKCTMDFFSSHLAFNLKQSKSILNLNIHNLKHNICPYITKQLLLWKLNPITTNFHNIHYNFISQIKNWIWMWIKYLLVVLKLDRERMIEVGIKNRFPLIKPLKNVTELRFLH
jgi:hypothetical protein